MTTINVTVRERIAAVEGEPTIICGNSDYTVHFDFDSEWSAYNAKTARFKFYQNGLPLHYDVLFTGDTVAVPALDDTYEVEIGVYAGDIRTTTGARVACTRSITDGDAVHPDPPADVYAQLLEYLERIGKGAGAIGAATFKCYEVNADKIGFANYPEFPARLGLMNGVWMQNLNAATYFSNSSTRVTMQPLCNLPAGKEVTLACQTSNIRISIGFFDASGIITYGSGWQSSPLTVANTSDHDVGCCVNVKFSNDANITPETAGSVTASVD